MITWVQRRGQIKHLLYELCLTGRIDKATLAEQFNDLNSVTPVVHCKDCKWCEGEGFYCEYDRLVHTLNDFCSRGEKVSKYDE